VPHHERKEVVSDELVLTTVVKVEPDRIAAAPTSDLEAPMVAGTNRRHGHEASIWKFSVVHRPQIILLPLLGDDRQQVDEAEHAAAVAHHERLVRLREEDPHPPFDARDLVKDGGAPSISAKPYLASEVADFCRNGSASRSNAGRSTEAAYASAARFRRPQVQARTAIISSDGRAHFGGRSGRAAEETGVHCCGGGLGVHCVAD
jgi:hypothetical protein